VEHAAVAVVLDLDGGIEATDRLERELRAVGPGGRDVDELPRLHGVRDGDLEGLLPGQPERRAALAGLEDQRQDTHAHQVRAVDALEALGDDGRTPSR
jgi:hypothetical protein